MKSKQFLLALLLVFLVAISVSAVSAQDLPIADDAISENVLDDNSIESSGNDEVISASDDYEGNLTADNKIQTKIAAIDVVTDYRSGENFVATLSDAEGKAIKDAMITLKIGTITRVVNTDARGQVSFSTDVMFPGTYPATAVYNGDNTYEGSSASAQVIINKLNTRLTAEYDYRTHNIVAVVKDIRGNPASNIIVGFDVNGMKYETTDRDGVAKYYTGGLPEGDYSVDVFARSDFIYNESNMVTVKFTLGSKEKTKIFLRNALYFVTETKMVRVTLWDSNNQPLAGKTVHVRAYSSTWSGVTDKNGDALIRVGIGFGNHSAIVSFDGDANYAPSEKSGYIRVIKQTPSVMVRGADSIFKASQLLKVVKVQLRDRYDNPLPLLSKIVFRMNGQVFVSFTDLNGVAYVLIDVDTPGTYTAQASYAGNTAYNAVTRDIRIKITP